MSEPTSPPNSGNAMQQAVAAEQAARRAIAESEAQAVATVERARAQARTILNAVPGRIGRLRERGLRTVQRALAAIEADETAATLKLRETAYAPELLERALDRLVRRLTGESGTARGGP